MPNDNENPESKQEAEKPESPKLAQQPDFLKRLAQQSTEPVRQVMLLFLADYRNLVCEALPDPEKAAAIDSVVGHMSEIVQEMPAASIADLFVRARVAAGASSVETLFRG